MFEYSFYLILTWVLIYGRCLAWDVSLVAPTPFGFLFLFRFLFLFFFLCCIINLDIVYSSTAIEEVYSLEMFTTDLVFSYLDLGLLITFNSEIVTRRSPSKCFLTFGVIYFFGTGSHNNCCC